MESKIESVGTVTFPEFSGLRIMHMPFMMEDLGSIPEFAAVYRRLIGSIVERSSVKAGVGYVTIDEALVRKGTTHRRPGLHVDGNGAWGGAGGTWGRRGMFVAATHIGCRGWNQDFEGFPIDDGDCAHMRDQCNPAHSIIMGPSMLYWCSPHAVHEGLPMFEDTKRQWIRVSMPNSCDWYDGYTVNPLVKPEGRIMPRRSAQMAYRP